MKQRLFHGQLSVFFLILINTLIHQVQSQNANITVSYVKVGACNSSIIARIGDYCDYLVTINFPTSGSSSSTDIDVEILLPDNDTLVMEMSKPKINYVGSNFVNPSALYAPTVTMSSSANGSQFDNAKIDFGTVTNGRLSAPNNSTENTIVISFRSILVYNPSSLRDGAQYWVTVGIEFNNVSEIWIGQALFTFSNSSSTRVGSLSVGSIVNSSLQIPQGSPFKILVPIIYNATYSTNVVFTLTNDNPTKLGLCAAYIDSATDGFFHLPTLGYEISTKFTTRISPSQIQIRLSQLVNAQSYNTSTSTLYIGVYGRVFETDGTSSFTVGSLSLQITSTNGATTTRTFTFYATSQITPIPINGSLPTFAITSPNRTYSVNEPVSMRVTMTVPVGFSAPIVFDLNGALNFSTPVLKSCGVVFESAGENVAGSNPYCADTSSSRRTYMSSNNSTISDQLTYDYGVLANLGSRPTSYSSDVNTIVFDAVFQIINTTLTPIRPIVIITIGNNTIWLGDMTINITVGNSGANISNATKPSFQLSYEITNSSNQSLTYLGNTRLFYYDIYTKPTAIYSPMLLRITTNQTSPGVNRPAITICSVKVLYVGKNVPCLVDALYNTRDTTLITYESRFSSRKYDTAYVALGPLCNYASTQTDDEFGRIRLGIYVKIENDLGDNQSSYVNLDVFYASSNLWVGQILFTGRTVVSPTTVLGTPLLFPINNVGLLFNRNKLTVVQFGLKIPPASAGTYSSLTSTILNDANQATGVCRVDMSKSRGANVPCSNDISFSPLLNTNGYTTSLKTDLGYICNVATNASAINGSLTTDQDTLILNVFLLANSQTASTFGLSVGSVVPYGQAALGTVNVSLASGTVGVLGNASSITLLNATVYRDNNDTNSLSAVFPGQDIRIRAQINLQSNMTTESCYNILFQFSIGASAVDVAYFTNAFVITSGDNIMCVRSQAKPTFGSGGSLYYNASMYFDLGVFCYYPYDLWNDSANTITVQANFRVPFVIPVPLGNQFSINTAVLLNQNQSVLNTSTSFTMTNITSFATVYGAFNQSSTLALATSNSTILSSIRQPTSYTFKIYIPEYAQGRLLIKIAANVSNGAIPVHIISARVTSAGVNVGSFMYEYALGDRYQWSYGQSLVGSSYKDSATLDLGIVSNTGGSLITGNYSNSTDNYIFFEATAYLTDCPGAENNVRFSLQAFVNFGQASTVANYMSQVVRNGSEKPIMFMNRTDLTSGVYGPGDSFSTVIRYGHLNQSNAECINAQIMVYVPDWIQLVSYNASPAVSNYSTDNSSYILFQVGTLLFNDVNTLQFTLLIGTSNSMLLAFSRYYSPAITIPYELMCSKRARNNSSIFPASKVFAFNDIIRLGVSINPVSASNNALLSSLQSCQFTTSVRGSDASAVRTTGWLTGYRSNRWMLSGATYVQISFGNLTSVQYISLSVPGGLAPIRTVKIGYSWDGIGFIFDTKSYDVNGSASYSVPLTSPLLVRYLRVYLIDVVNPSDLLTMQSGFKLNITGAFNGSGYTTADVCQNVTNSLETRTVLLAPPLQAGLTYGSDIYVCDERTTRTGFQCYVLHNGDSSASATWNVLNTTVANINLFAFDTITQTQSLYGYAQDGRSILRSDDRGVTWSVTLLAEYTNMTAACQTITKVCTLRDSYPLTVGPPFWLSLQAGAVAWGVSIQGVSTQQIGGTLVFDWFN